MDKNFIKLYESDKSFNVELAKTVLKDNNIESVIINKQDSSYVMFGVVELYVHKDKLEEAKILMEKFEENE